MRSRRSPSALRRAAPTQGMGAAQIRFVTRSGTNQFRGSVFHTYRSDELNANTWFNKRDGIPKAELLRNQPGFNVGGPIVLPKFDGRNRAFFFVNYEELREPAATTANPDHPDQGSAAGHLPLQHGSGRAISESVSNWRRGTGQTSTPDPIIAQLLTGHPQCDRSRGQRQGPHRSVVPGVLVPGADDDLEPVPDGPRRLPDHRSPSRDLLDELSLLEGRPGYDEQPRPVLPRLPGRRVAVFGSQGVEHLAAFDVRRRASSTSSASATAARRSTSASNDFVPSLWSGSLANQGGHLPQHEQHQRVRDEQRRRVGDTFGRDAYHRTIENTLNWQKGSHSINMGGLFSQFDYWAENQQVVPELRFEVVQGDPAEPLFVAANFPGASTTNLTNARRLYAILTGRVSELRGIARLNETTGEYEYLRGRDCSGRARPPWASGCRMRGACARISRSTTASATICRSRL